ncbi:hypothetical protein CCR75_005889 [Bremia lactucae]|uniref:Uncharacterized protein n=1 Tax=Bremia lactucae TaxID=4779 RepID=A0A976FMP7_BRELC|nr:hypothetical protein CCR75_005889 [Bremia lactucae]
MLQGQNEIVDTMRQPTNNDSTRLITYSPIDLPNLTHVPTGLQAQCQKTRLLDGNRRAARKLLQHNLDDHVNGELSKRSLKINRLRRKKANRSTKATKKYTNPVDTKLKEKEQAEGIASNAVTMSDEDPESGSGNENESDDDDVDWDLKDSKVRFSRLALVAVAAAHTRLRLEDGQ